MATRIELGTRETRGTREFITSIDKSYIHKGQRKRKEHETS